MTLIISAIKMRPIRWIIVIGWTILISILLVQPEQNPVINTGVQPGPMSLERELIFTTAHLIGFGITCALWFWAWFGHVSLSRSLFLGIGFAMVIGMVTEYLQGYAPDRNPSLIDFFANCTGALLMAYVIWRKQTLFSHNKFLSH